MNEDGIAKICSAFDLKFGRAYAGTATWGSHMSVACPLAIKTHGDPFDDNMSCSIEVVNGGPSRVKCWSGNCKFKGKLVQLVRVAVKLRGSPPELIIMLKEVEQLESISLAGRVQRSQIKVKQGHGPEQARDWAPPPSRDREVLSEKLFAPFAGKVPQYAIERGITVETAKTWGLGYDKAGHYLVFPVRRRDRALVGLVGRGVSDKAKRPHHIYMGLDKSKHMFGAHMLVMGKPVVILESCIDSLNTWQALEGEVNTVATLGEGFSDRHALSISTVRPPFAYIFTDGDPAGRLMASKIAYVLHSKMVPTKIIECPWGPIVGLTSVGLPLHQKIDPSLLPYPMIRSLYRSAKVVLGGKIKWTRPIPIFDPLHPAQ